MDKKALEACFDLTPVERAGEVDGIIFGVKDGMVVSRKADSHLGPHIAVLGSSGSMKSRTISRGVIISCAKQGRSLVVTDPKGELASDTMEYLKGYGYDVKILNAVDPYNSHRFDCLENEVKGIKVQLEKNIIPRLTNIEACYVSTYERYMETTEKIDRYMEKQDLFVALVLEHEQKFKQLGV